MSCTRGIMFGWVLDTTLVQGDEKGEVWEGMG